MRVLFTRLARQRRSDMYLPYDCYAWESMRAIYDSQDECDCITFCKYGPGNTPALCANASLSISKQYAKTKPCKMPTQ